MVKLPPLAVVCFFGLISVFAYGAQERPNILFCISDDQSWLHTSIAGDPVVKTPAFDRIAEEGLLFRNSYTACPSCAPSRAAVLTGQNFWRLEEGGLLFGRLRMEFPIYTKLLEENGYELGMTGKGYAPSNQKFESAWKDPCGKVWTETLTPPEKISNVDYASGFAKFMEQRDEEKPFCFWLGVKEPHRAYGYGNGAASGMDLDQIVVPPFLPDSEKVRNDVADYLFEIEWFDQHLARVLKTLEETGELENTLIVVTSDNGMPFPRAKATAYNYGVHMPLAIRWGNGIKNPGRVIDDFVNHTDFAPTFLKAAGVKTPKVMTGRDLLKIFNSKKEGWIDRQRRMTVTGLERHVWARPEGKTYPRRVIHTEEFVYIRNYEADRWPMGSEDFVGSHQGNFSDIDSGASKAYMLENKDEEGVKELYVKAFLKLPEEELYSIKKDPAQMDNLASNPEYASVIKRLKSQMERYQTKTGDPRVEGKSPWDDYPFYAKKEYVKGAYLEEYEAVQNRTGADKK